MEDYHSGLPPAPHAAGRFVQHGAGPARRSVAAGARVVAWTTLARES
jgi:hypothetical protein